MSSTLKYIEESNTLPEHQSLENIINKPQHHIYHHRDYTYSQMNTNSYQAAPNGQMPYKYSNPYNNSTRLDHSNPIEQQQNVSQSLLKRDTEIERLKMRIFLLETQTNDISAYPSLSRNSYHHDTVGDSKLRDLEYSTAVLRLQYDQTANQQTQLVKLENLLNQREFEIKELNVKWASDLTEQERQLVKFKTLLADKEADILAERQKNSNIQKDLEALKSRLNSREDYISGLRTQDEIKLMEDHKTELSNECQALKTKVRQYEEKHLRAKHVIYGQFNEMEAVKKEMEKCVIERERVQLEFGNYKKSTSDVGQLMEMVGENASLKSNLEISKKMCASLQEKLKSDGLNHTKEIESLKEKLQLENSSSKSLLSEIENYSNKLSKMDQALKKLSNDNQQIMNENCDKNEQIKALEVIINTDSLKLLQILFSELNMCTTDLDSLVKICADIYKQKDINVNQLIGSNSSNAINFIDLNDANLINNLINRDYLIRKSDDLKSLRRRLNEIRKFISDEYAERLGNDMSCIQQ